MLELTITQNTPKKSEKKNTTWFIFPWSIISVKKANVVSLVTKREKCFDR